MIPKFIVFVACGGRDSRSDGPVVAPELHEMRHLARRAIFATNAVSHTPRTGRLVAMKTYLRLVRGLDADAVGRMLPGISGRSRPNTMRRICSGSTPRSKNASNGRGIQPRPPDASDAERIRRDRSDGFPRADVFAPPSGG